MEIADGVWNSVTGKQEAGGEQLSESELKKMRRKAARQAAKKKQEDEKKKKKNDQPEKEDPLDADKLIEEAQKEPLNKAKEWASWIEDLNPDWLEGQLLAYEVNKRRQKPLKQLKALKRCISLGGLSHPAVHEITADWIRTKRTTNSEIVNDIMATENKQLNLNQNVSETNEQFLHDNINSLAHRLSYVKVKADGDVKVLQPDTELEPATISQFEEAKKLLEKEKLDSTKLMEQARAQWPLAVVFGAASDSPPRVLKPLKTEKKDEK